MVAMLMEIPYGEYASLSDIFGSDAINQLRKDFKNNCTSLAEAIKYTFNRQEYLAEIITFKNGNAYSDGGITVNGNNYTHHTIVLMGEWIIDLLHSDNIIKTKDYVIELKRHNPKLRIDYTMSTGWYTNEGYLYRPSLDDLINYKYYSN